MSRGSKPDQREPKHTIATTDPDEAIHTSAQGYDYHSRWLNYVARREWVCMNPNPGSCIWDVIGSGGGGGDTFIGLKDTPNNWLNEPIGQLLAHGNDEVIFTSSVDGLDGELNDPQNAGWLRGNEVHDSPPADGQVLTWNNTDSRWEPGVGVFRLSNQGDLHTHNGSADTILPIGSSNKLLKVTSVGEGEYEPRWGDLPLHAWEHESAGGDVINHQDLSGAGTNAHSAIDIHLGSTSNPHTVTPAQVGNATAQWNADKLQGNNVHTSSPSDGNVLTWNDTDSRWEAQAPSGGGSSDHNTIYADTYQVTETGTSAVTKKTFDYVSDSDSPAKYIKLIVGLWMTGGGTATCTLELNDGTTTKSDTVTSTASAEEDIKKISIDITAATALLTDTTITVNIKLHQTGGTTAHMKFTEVRELFA